ncbi:MAG TPA: DNA ligase D, partial [Longimicrobiales bacterium]|nr:DNA ligase D [Longimicrobiales bacterium]
IVWDRGTFSWVEDPHEGFEKGKLLFELRGYKLRGRWTLVKIKDRDSDADNTWLLIKEKDGLQGPGREVPEASILSGLTVEELGAGHDPAEAVLARLDELEAPERRVRASSVKPMLAEARRKPFDRKGWVFELKYDGYRIIGGVAGGRATLLTRNGNDVTASFPEVAASLEALPFRDFVVDGEVVVHDDRGIPSFQRLQQRAQLRRAADIARAAVITPATLYTFDLPGFGDRDLRPLPLLDRKDVLRMLIPPAGPLRYSDHIPEQGKALFQRVADMGLEGLVAKKADAPYHGGRSGDWLKIRADLVDDFCVVGWTDPKGTRSGFGALHLGAYDGDRLVYAGRAGTGFSEAQIAAAEEALRSVEIDEPLAEGAPTGRGHHWTPPGLVVEVRYREWTDEGLLRHPVFLRFRDDKAPSECVKRAPASSLPAEVEADSSPEPAREVRVTNADKVFWPEEGYTKGDLVSYYEGIADWLLPYLRDRPLVLTRFPDGIHGKSFYQKDAPDWAPDWLRTVRVWSEGSQRDLDYFVCDNVESLLWVANSASIPLHVWHSRVGSLERPDWSVIDLDPKEAPFEDVIRVAQALHQLCDEIGLDHFVKTSGSSGLHVLTPLARKFTHEQSRILAQLLSQVIVNRVPEIATLQRVIDRREGKVYLDYLQNGHGKLIVAPYSVRPKPGAPVSAPLTWEQVRPGLAIGDFTMANMRAHMESMGQDPLLPVLDVEPDLLGALERLQEQLT